MKSIIAAALIIPGILISGFLIGAFFTSFWLPFLLAWKWIFG